MAEYYPIVRVVNYSSDGVQELSDIEDEKQRKLLITYPTVYVIGNRGAHDQQSMYVGETNDIIRRTIQHLDVDPDNHEEWKKFNAGHDGKMVVIGHEHFNKSMTLDIENQLMLYLSGNERTYRLINGRTNPQGGYYPKAEKQKIFSRIWRKLHQLNPDTFPVERVILDSALFKASPFHELTKQQRDAREQIIAKIQLALQENKRGQLIVVNGEAGSGKTVLLSSLFYSMMTTIQSNGDLVDQVSKEQQLNAKLMVNHDQQVLVYQQVMSKLGLYTKNGDQVNKPTHFINTTPTDGKPIDVALIDEAHLLYTQGKQSYQGDNQLADMLEKSRVVVAIVDPHQVLATNEYRTQEDFQRLMQQAKQQGNLITLTHQLRMDADRDTLNWLDGFIFGHRVSQLPQGDAKGYDLRIFDSPSAMQHAIQLKAQDETNGLSRMLATFDWPYVDKKYPDGDPSKMWMVSEGKWSMPWNLQIPVENKHQKRQNKKLAWAEQPQTIDEIGSTFTVQGLDLNYAGVVLGPSVGFEDGRVVIRPENSANKKATQKRSLGKDKLSVADELLQNEVNVLLTRGVHGLYIYAVDHALRQALLTAQSHNELRVAEDRGDYKAD